VIAHRSLATPGGSETFLITVAEHLARLGHEVVVHALELGLAAKLARERAIHVVDSATQLPVETDATIAFDRMMAIDLARAYPRAARIFAMHNTEDAWLPPPAEGIVTATIAPNDRLATLARGSVGAGEVVRIRQPIDLRRFSPRGWAREAPRQVLLIGNYLGVSGQRVDQLREAWAKPEMEWRRLGVPVPTTEVAEEIAKADIVVGYGRSILEAMACGRPAYVHDHSGSDGWVTAESYDRLEADGFSGTGVRRTPSVDQLRQDLLRYDTALGRVGQDLARTHHDARLVAAELIALVRRLEPPSSPYDPAALMALRNLAEGQLRADLLAERYRLEAKAQSDERRSEQIAADKERAALFEANALTDRLRGSVKRYKLREARLRAELSETTARLNATIAARRSAPMKFVFGIMAWIRSFFR